MLSQLQFFVLPCLLMSSPTLEVLDYNVLSQNMTSVLPVSLSDNEEADNTYKLFNNYFPLLLMLISMPENETESLEKYMKQRTYAELKRMIDEKQKVSDITRLLTELEQNQTDLSEFVALANNRKYLKLLEAYHNASIYNAIRGVWSSQLNPLLPPIDQLAILEYFAERRSNEHFRMSFWSRIWAAIRKWLTGNQELLECNANEPRCMRRIIEKLPLELRVELDRAAESDNLSILETIIIDELYKQPQSAQVEFEKWKNGNLPPPALLNMIADKTELEEKALERLRAYALLNSLKDYYRAMIESRSEIEQEEIQQFFQRMNDSFARCFNPTKYKYEYGY
ncbi:hypothetical protein KIN20_006812 [Parelaphostrongylus tenuis]|uniref:Uncharacterized protein n=1 Tax=Parelaphostrongylus tenuis TaxID=148309 RepID=A0AAD5M6M4_PARTN|nr:hypothetical protein KIN20_006812 [Parelaphostrongylus tenuis]